MTEPYSQLDVPPHCRGAGDCLLEHPCPHILVIGETDTGKSAFCRYLAHRFHRRGRTLAFLDADIGQKDLGPPATVTLAGSVAGIPPSAPSDLHFVGAVDPRGHSLPLTVGLAVLASRAHDRPLVINTPGILKGPGRRLLQSALELLTPDAVIALERHEEAGAILSGCPAPEIMRLRPSRAARRKGPGVRRERRRQAFRAYFATAEHREYPLRDLRIQRSLLFTGRPISREGTYYGEDTAEGRLLVTDEPPEGKGTKAVSPGFEQGLLCGVTDNRGEGVGLARLERIDFRRGTVALTTPAGRGETAGIQLGDLYLGTDWTELGRKRPRHL